MFGKKQMAKVGVLYFEKAKDRNSHADSATLFDTPKLTIGFQYIVNEAAKKHEIRYVDTTDSWGEFWLASLVSWYDVYNLVHALGGKKPRAKLIVGGPGMLNPWILHDLIYAAVIGRGEGVINRVIEGDKTVSNACYYDEPSRQLTIGQPTVQIDGGHEKECACGCPKKCFFCEYGWKYKYKDWSGQYSEYANGETFFRDIDWTKGSATAGLDGTTEKERWVVNKPLKSDEIVETFSKHVYRDNFRLKLFCVTAYPFTNGYDFKEWEFVIEMASKVVKKPITIMLSLSHFCPMPFTPMEEEKVLFFDRLQQAPRQTGKIKWATYLQGTTVASAAYEAMIYRGLANDDIISFIMKNKPSGDTAILISETFPHIVNGGYIPIPLIERPFNVEKMKMEYRKRILTTGST